MAGGPSRRWWPILLLALGLPVAWAATLSVTAGTLASGKGAPAPCDSAPNVVQNVGTASPNTTNIVSVDVSGIVPACGGGTLKVGVYNGSNAVQEATKGIPAGGGSVNVPLTTAVPLRDSHFVAVTLQGP